jgi:hypothetical protein
VAEGHGALPQGSPRLKILNIHMAETQAGWQGFRLLQRFGVKIRRICVHYERFVCYVRNTFTPNSQQLRACNDVTGRS